MKEMAVICKKQPYTMIVEVENLITKKDLRKITIKAFYKRPSSQMLLYLGILSAALLCTGVVSLNSADKVQNYFLLFLIVLNLIMPFYLARYADQQYSTSTVLKGSMRYVFGEEKISFQGDGIEGNYDWNKIIKYSEMKHFLLLYFSAQQITFIKTDTLTAEQLNFIKSKIQTK